MVINLYNWFVLKFIGRIEWSSLKYFFTGRYYDLTEQDQRCITKVLNDGWYFGLLHRKTHFTTYLISLGHFIVTRRWAKWSHGWMDGGYTGIKIIEAIGAGVKINPWWKVFDCDGVVILRNKKLDVNAHQKISRLAIEWAKENRGYDTWFNDKDSSKLSCCELIYASIKEVAPYATPNLDAMIEKYGRLTPDMIYDCGDFEIVLEIKR